MELDDFKEVYKSYAGEAASANQDIDGMINRESKGPLAVMKKNAGMGLFIYPSAIIFYMGIFSIVLGISEVVRSPINWILFAVFFMEFTVSVINYFAIKKLQLAGGTVKDNMLNKVNLLRQVSNTSVLLYIALFCMMPLFIEADIYFHLNGQFQGVAKINVFIRIAWYVLIFGGMFVIRRDTQRLQYNHYLGRLKRVLTQMQ